MNLLKPVLVDIADAVREKTGKTDLIKVSDLPEEIRGIEAGGVDLIEIKIKPRLLMSNPPSGFPLGVYTFYMGANISNIELIEISADGTYIRCKVNNLIPLFSNVVKEYVRDQYIITLGTAQVYQFETKENLLEIETDYIMFGEHLFSAI